MSKIPVTEGYVSKTTARKMYGFNDECFSLIGDEDVLHENYHYYNMQRLEEFIRDNQVVWTKSVHTANNNKKINRLILATYQAIKYAQTCDIIKTKDILLCDIDNITTDDFYYVKYHCTNYLERLSCIVSSEALYYAKYELDYRYKIFVNTLIDDYKKDKRKDITQA